MESPLSSFIDIAPFLIFPILSFVVAYLLNTKGGWYKLSKLYPGTKEKPKYMIKRTTIYVGIFMYNRAVNLGLGEKGIHLSTFFLFKWANPPIFIPWEAVTDVKFKKGIFASTYEIRVENIKLTFLAKDFQMAEKLLQEKINDTSM